MAKKVLKHLLKIIISIKLLNFLWCLIGWFLFHLKYRPTKFHKNGSILIRFLNKCFLDYYYHMNKDLSSVELNRKFWKEFGAEYLRTMNTRPIAPYYMNEVYGIIEKRNVSCILELGCGYLRHLQHLAERYPYLELYGIDITDGCVRQAEKLNNERIKVISDDILNLDKYVGILQKTDLIFSYGIFCYLERSDFERVCKIIAEHFKGMVVYNDAVARREIRDLTDSIQVNSQNYVHPYLEIFSKYNLEQIKFEYEEDKESFLFVGRQR